MFEDFRERVIKKASELCKRYLQAHKALFDCIQLVTDRLCSKRTDDMCDQCDNEDCCMTQEELRRLYDDLSKVNRLIFDLEYDIKHGFSVTQGDFLRKGQRYLEDNLELWKDENFYYPE